MRSPKKVKAINVLSTELIQPSANGSGIDVVFRFFPITETTQFFVRCLKAAVSKFLRTNLSIEVNSCRNFPYWFSRNFNSSSPLSFIFAISVDFGSYAVTSIFPTTFEGSLFSLQNKPSNLIRPFPVLILVLNVQIILRAGRMIKNGVIAAIDDCSNLLLYLLLSAPSLSDPALEVYNLKLVAWLKSKIRASKTDRITSIIAERGLILFLDFNFR